MKLGVTTVTKNSVFDFLVSRALQDSHPVNEVHLTLDEIATATGKSKRTVCYALDDLSQDGRVVDRKPRRIKLKLPTPFARKSDIRGTDYSGQDLSGWDLRGADLSGCTFDGSNMQGALLSRARLVNTSLKGADLSGANLRKSTSFRADFSNANLTSVDAYSASFSHTNFSGAVMDGAKVGTPLQSGAAWDNVLISSEQIQKLVGLAHSKLFLAILSEHFLHSHSTTAFVSGLIESPRYGCWNSMLSYVGTRFSEYLKLWVRTFRERLVDPMTSSWLELELSLLHQGLLGCPVTAVWESLNSCELPRVWSVYSRWKYNVEKGDPGGVEAVSSDDELEQVGGCGDHYIAPTAPELTQPGRVRVPKFLSENDKPVLISAVEKCFPLCPNELGSRIQSYYRAKPGLDHGYQDIHAIDNLADAAG
jgi:uncharacterized protein YjbI with pentapeptide repeats